MRCRKQSLRNQVLHLPTVELRPRASRRRGLPPNPALKRLSSSCWENYMVIRSFWRSFSKRLVSLFTTHFKVNWEHFIGVKAKIWPCLESSECANTVADTSSRNGQQIYDLACDGLHYLDTRTDFWRQQKPMYSRKREKQDRLKGNQKKGNHENYVMNQLERIDNGKCYVIKLRCNTVIHRRVN